MITHFAQTNALLPVMTKNSDKILLLPWGRRKNESGQLPLGGWASMESLEAGKWDKYFPKPVKLDIHKFMEQDFEGQFNWFDVTSGQWIQGIYVEEKGEKRVYIVTLTPSLVQNTYPRWPKILSG